MSAFGSVGSKGVQANEKAVARNGEHGMLEVSQLTYNYVVLRLVLKMS